MTSPGDGPDLSRRFEKRLAPAESACLNHARAWCERTCTPLYLVGGSVRDLLLDRPHVDLDLAVDGDAAALGRELAGAFGAELTMHEHFSTAALVGAGWTLDLARTRAERYAYPAALPDVAPAPIEADLRRRDFTVQAMALVLAGGDETGELLDPFGGRADLSARRMRVLHVDSFRDDPTRIFRLARYTVRLDFTIEPKTAAWATRDARFLDAVSGARITHELERTFAEDRPVAVLTLLDALHAVRALVRQFRLPVGLDRAYARLRQVDDEPPGMAEYLAALAACWDRHTIQQLVDRLELRHEVIAALRACPQASQMLRQLSAVPRDAVLVVDALADFPPAALRGVGAALGGRPWTLVRQYLHHWRHVRSELRGDEVIALGVPRGPAVGEVLRLLRDGKLRGELRTRAQEETAVRLRLGDEAVHAEVSRE